MNDSKAYPIITIVASSLYALMYYYDKNYALINSKTQFLFLVSLYIILPLLTYFILDFLFKHFYPKENIRRFLLPVINLVCFFAFIVVSVYGFQKVKLVLSLVLGVCLGILFAKYIKKIVVIQFILAFLVLPKLIPDIYREVVYSKQWMEQPDTIEKVVFKKRPNIYVIQPDGYASFSTFKDSIYNYDNSEFEVFLKTKGFKTYDDYRSNYYSTLSTNSSMFSMKHHYYGNTTLGINPRHNRRNEIVESNPVLRILKHNNYKTFLMLQVPYLLSNRPNIDFDYCNFSLDEVSYISRGFSKQKELIEDTKAAIIENKYTSNFFFIESMLPSHITTEYKASSSAEKERVKYLEQVGQANEWLMELVNFITEKDPNGLIIIAADHGGFVGFNYTIESKTKVTDPILINSMFSSILAIKWPNNTRPNFDSEIKTSVNLFRVLFSHLSEDESYLDNLQDNKSYIIIRKGAPTGIYEYIDESGLAVFNKIE
ncbi:hypothetical protein [uncultured Winogradskyella sp.]|uniref:hypothetical protein n=1 Tax=uncultured Winogradskyella sp. TaxID=395353 RepID=UPI00262C3901|nr:hypothetical protein [uncultured Winogradskyella sp.]